MNGGRVEERTPARSGIAAGPRNLRARVRSWPGGRLIWRVGVTLVGVLVIAVGIVLLPLPGPGWLIIFAGLGLLATEYEWAARLLRWLRDLVLGWTRWAAARPVWVRAVLGLLSVAFLAAVAYGAWYVYRRM